MGGEIMNTVIHFVDSALMYHRGKQTGLAGLMGIILTIVIAAYWEQVLPLFKFIGVVSLLDSMGLIIDGAPGMTFYRIMVAAFALSLALMLIGSILLAITLFIVAITQNEFFQKILIGLMFVVFFPLVLLYWFILLLGFIADKDEKRLDPKGYAEKKRLAINKDVINYFINAGIEDEKKRLERERDELFTNVINGKEPPEKRPNLDEEIMVQNNVLTFEEAYNRLNRLPTKGDYFFLLGITYERELCILIPKPVAPKCLPIFNDPDTFVGEKIKLTGSMKDGKFQLDKHKEYIRKTDYPDTLSSNNVDFDPFRHTFTYFKYDEIETYVDLSKAKEIHPKLKFYMYYKHFIHFIEEQQNLYFSGKEYLKQQISDATNKEDFDHFVSEIKKYNASNEGAVQYIWEQEQIARQAEG